MALVAWVWGVVVTLLQYVDTIVRYLTTIVFAPLRAMGCISCQSLNLNRAIQAFVNELLGRGQGTSGGGGSSKSSRLGKLTKNAAKAQAKKFKWLQGSGSKPEGENDDEDEGDQGVGQCIVLEFDRFDEFQDRHAPPTAALRYLQPFLEAIITSRALHRPDTGLVVPPPPMRPSVQQPVEPFHGIPRLEHGSTGSPLVHEVPMPPASEAQSSAESTGSARLPGQIGRGQIRSTRTPRKKDPAQVMADRVHAARMSASGADIDGVVPTVYYGEGRAIQVQLDTAGSKLLQQQRSHTRLPPEFCAAGQAEELGT